jgi:hypothetical protein
MFRKVRKYIKGCDLCNKNKNDYSKPPGKMVIDENEPTEPWKRLTADFVEMPRTTSIAGAEIFDELLVVVDKFSKQTILIPTRKTATTEEVFYLLWERVFSVFGIPDSILSDRDRIFKTERWQQLMKEVGAVQLLSTAYHQRTDGQTERKIQEIRAYFRYYLDYEQKNWVELTPIAQYALNDAKSAATGETPNFVTFGSERLAGKDQRLREPDTVHQEMMKIIHKEVKLDLEWNKLETKKYYDRRRVETPTLERGDKVYIRRRTSGEKSFNIKTGRESQKLDCVRIGPYRIEAKLPNDNYRVTLPPRMRIHPVFHISLLSKTDNPISTGGEDIVNEYEVEEIMDKRRRKGIMQISTVLISWNNFTNLKGLGEYPHHLKEGQERLSNEKHNASGDRGRIEWQPLERGEIPENRFEKREPWIRTRNNLDYI